MTFPADEENLSEKCGYEDDDTCSLKRSVTNTLWLCDLRLHILHWSENYFQ